MFDFEKDITIATENFKDIFLTMLYSWDNSIKAM